MNDDAGSGPADRGAVRPTARPSRQYEPLPTDVSGLPELPAGYHRIVDAGIAALFDGSSRPTSPPTPEALHLVDDHVLLLLAWNAAINLTAIRDPVAAGREHVLDSLAALPILRERGVRRLLDLGSGGGYPGLPLAIALPAERALLVESIGKKAAFLGTAVSALGLGASVEVAANRAEALAGDRRHREAWPAVVARAVADLAELAELALPLVAVGGVLVAWKRTPIEPEIDRAREVIAALGGGTPAVRSVPVPGLDDHVLLLVDKLRPTPRTYPRSPAERRRRRQA